LILNIDKRRKIHTSIVSCCNYQFQICSSD
jgi:hypothetical protein